MMSHRSSPTLSATDGGAIACASVCLIAAQFAVFYANRIGMSGFVGGVARSVAVRVGDRALGRLGLGVCSNKWTDRIDGRALQEVRT